MGEVLCLLFAGHAIGDFYLQSDELASQKERSTAALLRHGGLYALGLSIGLAPLACFLGLPAASAVGAWAALSLAHVVVDGPLRSAIKRVARRSAGSFLLDQALHLACCVLAGLCLAPRCAAGFSSYWSETLVWGASLLLSGAPVCVLVKLVLGDLRQAARDHSDPTVNPGDPVSSGRAIGVLERVLICTLALLGEFGAIAFVITAKSIARYEKMKDDKAFAEIYLVGTLASVAGAIAVPLLVSWMVAMP